MTDTTGLPKKKDVNILITAIAGPYAYADDAPYIRTLLKDYGINDANSGGFTPLMAAALGKPKIARMLVGEGALVDKRNSTDDYTALMYAARNGQADTVLSLIGSGADVNAANIHGETPLMLAASRGNVDIVRALIDGGADIGRKNLKGETALMCTERFQRVMPKSSAHFPETIGLLSAAKRQAEADIEKRRAAEAARRLENLKQLKARQPQKSLLKMPGPRKP